MSNIKVCVKIHPLSQRDVKSKKEDQWVLTDNNSLQCTNIAHPCQFTFDHVFSTKSLNYEVYSSIVEPIFESCLIGFNGTILTYGSSSAGKNHTMVGTNMDPGILLITIERLFVKIGGSPHHTIRFGYIEIYKEKIFDLLNDRQPVSMDQNKKFDFMLSNTEIVAENFEKAARIMFDGSYKRKSSADDATKLSSLSHSIFRITIESEDKANGKMQISYLRFVHVAACEPMTESPSSESLQDEGNKSLYWLSVVIDGLNDGENNINFNNSILTMLLREPLTGKSNTAIVCNVRPDDDAEKTIATLEFISRAKNVRTFPMRNEMYDIRASSSPANASQLIRLEDHLKDMANLKAENLLLRGDLEEVKTANALKREWFAEQMRGAQFAQQKLEHDLMEQKRIQNGLQLQIKHLTNSNEQLMAKLEGLHNGSSLSVHHEPYESLTVIDSGSSMFNTKYVEKQQDRVIEKAIKRKSGSESDWSESSLSAHHKLDESLIPVERGRMMNDQHVKNRHDKGIERTLQRKGSMGSDWSEGSNNESSLSAHQKPDESLVFVEGGRMPNDRCVEAFERTFKRKGSLESDWSQSSKSRKFKMNGEQADVDQPLFSECTTTLNRDKSETCTLTVQNSLIGRLMGTGGSRLTDMRNATSASIAISERNGESHRRITVNGNSRAVGMAVDMIKKRLEFD